MNPRLTRYQKLILQKLDHAHGGCAYFSPRQMNSLLALQYYGFVRYAGAVFELWAITDWGRDFLRWHVRKRPGKSWKQFELGGVNVSRLDVHRDSCRSRSEVWNLGWGFFCPECGGRENPLNVGEMAKWWGRKAAEDVVAYEEEQFQKSYAACLPERMEFVMANAQRPRTVVPWEAAYVEG